MTEIEEIVRNHKSGIVPYHVALDELVHRGMIQEEAHELLFPPIGEGDFDPDIPFDPSDIMTVDLTKAMSKLNRKNYIEGGIHKITNLKIETEEEERLMI